MAINPANNEIWKVARKLSTEQDFADGGGDAGGVRTGTKAPSHPRYPGWLD